MTREELRRAFRQAQQEEFFMVPEQPCYPLLLDWKRESRGN